MKKVIIFLFLLANVYADNMHYAFLNKHAIPLHEGFFDIKGSYQKIDDTIDIFNIKESELGSLRNVGSIGDMDGYDFELRYGISDKDSIFFDYQRWNIDYGGTKLHNNKIELFNRYNLLSYSNGRLLNSVSIDFGFINNFAEPLDVKNETLLNAYVRKIKPGSNISIKDGSIINGDTTFSIYDANSNKVHPYLAIENLDSKSYYTRLLVAKKLSIRNMLDMYAGVKYTDITTKLVMKPENNSILNSALENYKVPNLNRSEMVYSLGFTTMSQIDSFLFEFNYEFNKIVRESEINYEDKNNIIEAALSYIVKKDFVVYVGGKIMMQQFNTDIPYLYNKYTQTQFDKKYGYAQVGCVYSFNALK